MKTLLRSAGARLLLGGGVIAAITMAACSDDPVAVGPVTGVEKTAGTDDQQAVAGTAVARAPEVTLTRAGGEKAVGETVTFTVTGGGGTVVEGVAVTDDRGIARVRDWILGQIAGTNSLRAASGDLEVTFNAIGIAGPAALVVISAGGEQTAPVNTPVPIPPEVLVTDQYGNGVQGATVQFRVVRGGGSVIGGNSVLSEPDGTAAIEGWLLGPTPMENILEATVQGFPVIQFLATATP